MDNLRSSGGMNREEIGISTGLGKAMFVMSTTGAKNMVFAAILVSHFAAV